MIIARSSSGLSAAASTVGCWICSRFYSRFAFRHARHAQPRKAARHLLPRLLPPAVSGTVLVLSIAQCWIHHTILLGLPPILKCIWGICRALNPTERPIEGENLQKQKSLWYSERETQTPTQRENPFHYFQCL
jgi:ABC-type sulfate transport system permease component